MIQSAFLWGYSATQLLGGSLADRHGGKIVIGYGLFLFSLSSFLLPLLARPSAESLGFLLPMVVISRVLVVSCIADQDSKTQMIWFGLNFNSEGYSLQPGAFVSVCVQGVGEGVVMPSINSLISRYVPFELKSTALGVVFLGFNLGRCKSIFKEFQWKPSVCLIVYFCP